MKKSSLLELLHPDGSASTSFVLGSNCPENLFPESRTELDREAALLILAPSAEECSTEGWLEGAVKSFIHRLSDDGVGYVLAQRRWRMKIARLLRKAGLVIDSSLWHFPDWASSRYLVPFKRIPAQFAFETILPVPIWKRIFARQMFRFPGTGLFLSYFWPSAGLVVRRPSSRPLFHWLFELEDEACSSGSAIIRTSWRGLNGAMILYRFSECDTLPSAIAKTIPVKNSTAGPGREAEALESLSPGARSAGAQVPQILLQEQNDQHSSLLLSVISGRSVSDLLHSHSDLLSPILERIVCWLERWHLSTVVVRPLEMEQLEQELLVPADLLAPYLQGAEKYRAWLVDRSQAAVGVPTPFVATHNDLTMANILLDEHDRLGVIDWETGQAESWPLVDFYYALTDAVRTAAGCTDWLDAFKACYAPGGFYTSEVASLQERLRSAVQISPGLAELSFHACWLHHASNEHQVSEDGEPRPFLNIVQWLALHHSKSDEKCN